MLKLISGIIVTLAVSVACGSTKKKDNSQVPTTAPAPQIEPVVPAPTPQIDFQQKLVGSWHEDCQKKGYGDSAYSAQQVYEFNADSVINDRTIQYKDTECKTESAYITLVGKYTVGDKNAKIADAVSVISEYQKIMITLRSDSAVETLNDGKTCGITDWKINEPREVSYGLSNCSIIKNFEALKDRKQEGYFIVNDNVMRLYTSEYSTTPELYKK
jgi:hypothetical protein